MSSKTIFSSAQDVESAFYEALEKADLDAMMRVWAEDEEIICVHPGGPRLVGYPLIREAWRRIFESGRRLQVQLSPLTAVNTPFAATHSLIGHVRIRDTNEMSAPLAVTNVYVRGALGWRMIAHHASVVPPESIVESVPKVLH